MAYGVWMTKLMNGDLIGAVSDVFKSTWGGYFYTLFFAAAMIMVYFKTESIKLTSMISLWTVILFGVFFPGTFTLTTLGFLTAAGIANIVWVALSPAGRK